MLPVFNVGYFNLILNVLKCICKVLLWSGIFQLAFLLSLYPIFISIWYQWNIRSLLEIITIQKMLILISYLEHESRGVAGYFSQKLSANNFWRKWEIPRQKFFKRICIWRTYGTGAKVLGATIVAMWMVSNLA